MQIAERLTACCWSTVSCTGGEIDHVQEASRTYAEGAIVVESCQRTEHYVLGECACDAPVRLRGLDAVRHLAEVAAGLQAVVLGEEQIQGQVREGVSLAEGRLRTIGDVALAAARALRSETDFESHSGHLLDRGLAMAGVEPGGGIAVVGAGELGKLVATRALALGFDPVTVVSRSRPVGAWFRDSRAKWRTPDRLAEVGRVRVLAACLGSDAGVLDGADLPGVDEVILDLGTPRNVAPAPPEVALLRTRDLLDDERGREHSVRKRNDLAARLHAILDRRLAMAAEDGTTQIGALRAGLERARRAEADRIARTHPELDRQTIDAITRALVNRIFHEPTERLRAADDTELARQVAELFLDQHD